MAGRTQEAWNEVGERFSAWGRLVAEHYRETEQADAGPADTEQADTERAEETQHKLEETARELADQVNRAFTALGDTLRDERAKSHLKDAMRAVGDAVGVTVTETGEAIRRRVGSTPEPGGSTPDERAGGDTTAA
jgi:predicted transcriptional regulator